MPHRPVLPVVCQLGWGLLTASMVALKCRLGTVSTELKAVFSSLACGGCGVKPHVRI